MFRRIFIVTALAVFLAASAAVAADCPDRVGHWPYGSTTAIAHTGNHIVYNAGTVLKVADVRTPSAPTALGELRLGGLIYDLDAAGTTAVAAMFDRGLVTVDLSNPSSPSVASSLDGIGAAYAVALDGQTAWVTTGSGLVAVDVADLSQPTVISTSGLGDGQFSNLTVSGGLAVLSDSWGDRVCTVDISDPASPQLLGSVDVSWPAGVAIAGDYLYVADRSTGVQVIDISDPSNPSIVTAIEEGWDSYVDVEVADDLLLLSHRYYGLVTLDITTRSAPAVLARLATAGKVESTAFFNGMAFLADGHEGVAIASLADPSQPQSLATLPGSGPLTRLAAAGNLAAAVDVGDVVLFDVSDPAAPAVVSTYDADRYADDVQLAGGYAYLALSDRALQVVDVTDPAHPQEAGSLDIEKAYRLAVNGTRAVVADEGLLTVADVSDPAHPAELGRLTLDYSRRPEGVFLAGSAAYVSEYGAGVHVIDLSDPAHPVETELLEIDGATGSGAIQGNLLFIGDSTSAGVRIFDISDPPHPEVLSTLSTPCCFSGLDVSGNLLAMATAWDGVYIADIADPEHPVVVGTSPRAVDSEGDAALSGNLFLVAERDGGMEIFDLSGCAVEPPVASFTWSPPIPEAGYALQFTDASSGAITSWDWDFGDGHADSQQNPTRAFSRPGSFPVTLTVTGPQGSDSATRIVTVSGGSSGTLATAGSAAWRTVIPASAHTGGLNGTTWVSDVVLHNPGTIDTVAYLYFMETGRDNSAAPGWEINVDAGTSVELDDTVLALFGRSNTSGAIMVTSDRELLVTSRTYNDAATGTFGQFIPGLSVGRASASARLIQLTRGSGYRTNLGIANPSGSALVAKVRLRDGGGDQVGNVVSFSLDPYGFHQVTDIFPSDVGGGSADVWTDTAGGSFFAYASVVDNVTGDPVFILEAPAASELWIPAAAHVTGFQGTQWRTNLELANGSSTSPTRFTIELLEAKHDNSNPRSVALGVTPGQTNLIGDFLDKFFDYSGSAALHLTADRSDASVSSRTYNQTANGTYGQYIPGLTGDSAVTLSNPARLVQLQQSASDTDGFRTNIGVLNTTGSSLDVSIALHASDGTLLGTVPETLKPYEYTQVNKIFRSVTSSPVTNGYAVVTTTTSGGKVLIYASVVDNASGDPICVLPQ